MAKGLLILCLLMVGVSGARAAPSASVYLEELTWPELRADIQAGKTTILVPIGGTEQNGPQMALGKHNIRVHVLAGKIAARSATRWWRRSSPMSPRAISSTPKGI